MAQAKVFQTLHNVVNEIKNGDFRKAPYSYRPAPVFRRGGDDAPRVTWIRESKGLSVLVSEDPSFLISYWKAWSSTNQGVSLSFNPLNTKQGTRTGSKDGGNVLHIVFKQTCSLYLEYELESFEHLVFAPITFSTSLYSLEGSPEFRMGLIQKGDELTNVMAVFCGGLGGYYRATEEFDGRSDMEKAVVQIEVKGRQGESVGLGGVSLTLGNNGPICPYTQDLTEDLIPPGAIVFTEADSLPGFDLLDDEVLLYHTLGDPLSLTCREAGSYEVSNHKLISSFGRDDHGTHSREIPFLEGLDGWYSTEAWRGVKVLSSDLADRGSDSRPMNFATLLGGGAYWNVATYDPDWTSTTFSGLDLTPLATGTVLDLKVHNLAKTTRVAVGLPASPGRSWSGSESDFKNGWEVQHYHYLIPEPEVILPPYKSYRGCIKN